jgi:hypothetical protein
MILRGVATVLGAVALVCIVGAVVCWYLGRDR